MPLCVQLCTCSEMVRVCGQLLQSFFRLPCLGTAQGWALSCSAAYSTVLGRQLVLSEHFLWI